MEKKGKWDAGARKRRNHFQKNTFDDVEICERGTKGIKGS